MNTPNKLTLLRIILVPFFVAALLITALPHNFLIAGLIFAAASLTDMFDGKLARKNNQVTDFGKFADPLADKILVLSALICFVELGIVGAVPVIIILFRELMVTSMRLIAANKGKVVAANIWGKSKTVSQIATIGCIFLLQYVLELMHMNVISISPDALYAWECVVMIIDNVLIWISVIFAVISGVIYIRDNKEFIKNAR